MALGIGRPSTNGRDAVSAFLDGSGRAPGRPLIVTLSAGGGRDPLSGRTAALWAAKTANLVTDQLGLGPGAVVAVHLPPHWQAWTWLLGALWAGTDVRLGAPGDPADDADALVTTAEAAAGADAGEVVALSLLPLAAPGPVPPGVVDFDTDVRTHGDRFVPSSPCGSVLLPGAPRDGRLLDAGGVARPAGPGDVVLTTTMPADGGALRALWAAAEAGAALVLAPGGTRLGGGPLAASLAAEGCTLELPA